MRRRAGAAGSPEDSAQNDELCGSVRGLQCAPSMPLELARFRCLALLLCLSACSAPATPGAPGEPEGWADELTLPTAVDLNPDPHVLEVNIEARLAETELVAGTLTTLWTYNGGMPGPLLRAQVGDRLIVHFKNSLPEPTSIHWHGLRIPCRTKRPRVARHRQRTSRWHGAPRRRLRRAPGDVDVSLPHPGSCRRRHDGHGACRVSR